MATNRLGFRQFLNKLTKPSKELIDAFVKTGKIKPKDQTDKKVARPFTPEAGV